MKVAHALLCTIGIFAVWIAGAIYVHPAIGYAIFIGTTAWAGWDAHQIGLSRYKLGGPTSVASTVLGCLLLWVVVFPWYLINRGKIMSGKAEWKDGRTPPASDGEGERDQKTFHVTGVRMADRKPVEYAIQADSAGAAIADAESRGIEVTRVSAGREQVVHPSAEAGQQRPPAAGSHTVPQRQDERRQTSPTVSRVVSGTTIPGTRTRGNQTSDASNKANTAAEWTKDHVVGEGTLPYRLYSPSSVVLATFLGTPIAGGQLLWENYKRLGNPRMGRTVWMWCSLASLVLIGGLTALMMLAPDVVESIPNVLLPALQCGAMAAVANRLQQSTVKAHKAAGGKLASGWRAAGVGLLWLAVVGIVWFGTVLAVQGVAAGAVSAISSSSEVLAKDGATIDVRYESPITREQARSVGQRLLDMGYASNSQTAQVLVSRSSSTVVMTFPLQEGAWAKPGVADGFREIVRQLAPSVGGLPLRVRLVNSRLDEKAAFTVE